MGPKKAARLGRHSSSQARRKRESSEERQQRLEAQKCLASRSIANETPSARQTRLAAGRARQAAARAAEQPSARRKRLAADRARQATARAALRHSRTGPQLDVQQFSCAAFNYRPKIQSKNHAVVKIAVCTDWGERNWEGTCDPSENKQDVLSTVPSELQLEQKDHFQSLRQLSGENVKKFLENWTPEVSSQETRNLIRKICREASTRRRFRRGNGLISSGQDVCDCLEDGCPGCHFPCLSCASSKCGHECRMKRCWVYNILEIDGEQPLSSSHGDVPHSSDHTSYKIDDTASNADLIKAINSATGDAAYQVCLGESVSVRSNESHIGVDVDDNDDIVS